MEPLQEDNEIKKSPSMGNLRLNKPQGKTDEVSAADFVLYVVDLIL